MTVNMKEVGEWAAKLYEARTREVAASLYHVHPAYRVTTHEVMKQFSFNLAPWMVEFQVEFRKAMKKRHLLQVLRGKMKSDEWVKKYG